MGNVTKCSDCGVNPGEIHEDECDVERCSVCGGQRLMCFGYKECEKHDKYFSRWTGIWPGDAEAKYLELGLNEFNEKYANIFFVKPVVLGDVIK